MTQSMGICKTYNLYIGLKDKEKLQQLCSTQDFIDMVGEICHEYRIGFSMTRQMGGYMMSDGRYVVEESLRMTLTGVTEQQALTLADTLRIRLNQETIIVSVTAPEVFVVK